jgi:hypothetical protein
MLAGELGGERIVDPCAAAARLAIHRDRNADSGAAHSNPALRLAQGDGFGDPSAIFRVIDALEPVRPQVRDLMPLVAKPTDKLVLQQITSMIGGKSDAHAD